MLHHIFFAVLLVGAVFMKEATHTKMESNTKSTPSKVKVISATTKKNAFVINTNHSSYQVFSKSKENGKKEGTEKNNQMPQILMINW